MQVETFECNETANEPLEESEEALRIIDVLGLKGQQELAVQVNGRDSRCPYREMTAEENFVYRTLCPLDVELKNYKASPIPLRVLQVAAHAQSLGMFSHLYVWDRESVAIKDPVLVGYVGAYYFSPDKTFILARWGEELEAFATLIKRAVAAKKEHLTQAANSVLSRVQSMSDAEILAAGPRSTVGIG